MTSISEYEAFKRFCLTLVVFNNQPKNKMKIYTGKNFYSTTKTPPILK